MFISFSTTNLESAKRYLAHEAFKDLSGAQVQLVLDNIQSNKVRVQDPLMYSKPTLEWYDQELAIKFIELNSDLDLSLIQLVSLKAFDQVQKLIENGIDYKKFSFMVCDSALNSKNYKFLLWLSNYTHQNLNELSFSYSTLQNAPIETLEWLLSHGYQFSNIYVSDFIQFQKYESLGFFLKHKLILKKDIKSSLQYGSQFCNLKMKEKNSIYKKIIESIKN